MGERMILRTPYRAALMLCLCIGLLLPRVSGVLLDMIPGLNAVVVCTGNQLVVLHIGSEGQPVETAQNEPHVCFPMDRAGAGIAMVFAAALIWMTMVLTLPGQVDVMAGMARLRRLPVKRAPPSGGVNSPLSFWS